LSALPNTGSVIVRKKKYQHNGESIIIHFIFTEVLGNVGNVSVNIDKLYCTNPIYLSDGTVTSAFKEIYSGKLPVIESKYRSSTLINVSSDTAVVEYDVTDLYSGLSYYFRASAWNGVGSVYGDYLSSTPSIVVVSDKPSVVRDLSLSSVDTSALKVSWEAPADAGGRSIEKYLVEYDYAPLKKDIQKLSVSAKSKASVGSFCLSYKGSSTSALPADVAASRVKSALESLSNIGEVEVSQLLASDASNSYEVSWLITFVSNVGSVDLLSVGCQTFKDKSTSIYVTKVQTGDAHAFTSGSVGFLKKPLGSVYVSQADSVQVITVNSSSSDLGGYFYVHNRGEVSIAIDAYASALEMETILEGMMTIGNVTVTVADLTLNSVSSRVNYGRSWSVTFHDSQYESILVSTGGNSSNTVASGGSLIGSSPVVSVGRIAEKHVPVSIDITDLTEGTQYIARVSAYNGAYWSDSVASSISAAPKLSTPQLPENVFVSVLSDTQLLVWWSEKSAEARIMYNVQWSVSSDFSSNVFDSDLISDNFFVITCTSGESAIAVRVSAYNAYGYSRYIDAVPVDYFETQVLRVNRDASFSLLYSDGKHREWSSVIPAGASANDVKDALESIPAIQVVRVQRFDHSNATFYDLTSDSAYEMIYTIAFVRVSYPDSIQQLISDSTYVQAFTVHDSQISGLNLISLYKTFPSEPQDVVVTAVSNSELGVRWNAPLYDGGSPVSKYLIEWDMNPHFVRSVNATKYSQVVSVEDALHVDQSIASYSYQIVGLNFTTDDIFVRVSAYNGDNTTTNFIGGYSIAVPARPLDNFRRASCATFPNHCSIKCADQLLYKPVDPTVVLSTQDVANRLEISWQQPTRDSYGHVTSTDTPHSPNMADYYEVEWSTDADFSNSNSYKFTMIEADNVSVSCHSQCYYILGEEVQNVTVTSENGYPLDGGDFALVYVGPQSRKIRVVVSDGSSTVYILDSSVVFADGFMSINKIIYQIDSVNGQTVELRSSYNGGINDVVLAYYADFPSSLLYYDASYTDVKAHLEDQLSGLYQNYTDIFQVARLDHTYGHSWLVTFHGEMFSSNVDNLLVVSSASANDGYTYSGLTTLTANGQSTRFAKTTVEKLFVADAIKAGDALYLRIAAHNNVGLGESNIVVPSIHFNLNETITPRSLPGLPVNVTVWSVPTDNGTTLKVSWNQGESYGGMIDSYSVNIFALTANTNTVQNIEATNATSYETYVTVDAAESYVVSVSVENDLGPSSLGWFAKVSSLQTDSTAQNYDFYAGAQRAIPVCYDDLEECTESGFSSRVILARGLPGQPTLSVPLYPDVDVDRPFGDTWAMIYFTTADTNGDVIDKYRVEWGKSVTFLSDSISYAIVEGFEFYNITDLNIGEEYYVRVIPHSSAGYGTPSKSYPFTLHRQPDAPKNPTLQTNKVATKLDVYARSLLVQWNESQIDSVDNFGNGGNEITTYYVEWSKVNFSTLVPTIQTIFVPCDNSSYEYFRVSLTTTNDNSMHHDGEHYHQGEFFITGTSYSANIYSNSTAYDVKSILENMPNVGELEVTKSISSLGVTWTVTFIDEISTVPVLQVEYSNVVCFGTTYDPNITHTQVSSFSASSLYSWKDIEVTDETELSYTITDLLPGVSYYVRISAANDLGYGHRRDTAPSQLAVPKTRPSLSTQYEGVWGSPKIFVASKSSLLVKVGAPFFDGGSLTTNFVIEWDTVDTFDSGISKMALGSTSIPAYTLLCSACVSDILFYYNEESTNVTITYQGTSDIVRQLQTGSRIVITTTDDELPYTFIVANATVTTSSFEVYSAEYRELTFSTVSDLADLYLMGAQYEILDLTENESYYVRVAAENAIGVCDDDMEYITTECGGFIATSPVALSPAGSPAGAENVRATVLNESSVLILWSNTTDSVTGYRVESFTKSTAATFRPLYFGDTEVQVLESTNVFGGSFTLAYDDFIIELPCTVSAFNSKHVFYTACDLSSYLEPMDKFLVDSKIYTVVYVTDAEIHIQESVAAKVPNSDIVSSNISVRPKTHPIPYDVSPRKLTTMIENVPGFGQVHVERNLNDRGIGYTWTITFESNVGDVPLIIVNDLNLLGDSSVPEIAASEEYSGSNPDNYTYQLVGASNNFAVFTNLTPGEEYSFRIVAFNEFGDGESSAIVSATAGSVPSASSSIALKAFNSSALLTEFIQDAQSNGSPITNYTLMLSQMVNGQMSTRDISLPLNNQVQKVTVYAHTLPFDNDATFSLSIGSFYGSYVYVGKNDSASAYDMIFDVLDNNTYLSKPSEESVDLSSYLTPGQFIRVFDQDFRVCLNQDEEFQALYGAYNGSYIPLCDVETAYYASPFDAGYDGHLMRDIPLYTLDTFIGAIHNPVFGSSSIDVDAVGNLLFDSTELEVGDWIMLGHPKTGETFRIKEISSSIELGTVEDPFVSASLTFDSLKHATKVVQAIMLNDTSGGFGYRLRFRGIKTWSLGYNSTTMVESGSEGCLSTSLSAEALRSELMALSSIDDVLVSKSVSSDDMSVTYSVTFTGALVGGDVPLIEVIDVGTNGCTNITDSSFDSDVSIVRESVMPAYKLQKTPQLAYNVDAKSMQDALEELKLVARVDVSKKVENNGYSWLVTFNGFTPESSVNIPLLFVNSVNMKANINGGASVSSVFEKVIGGLNSTDRYFAHGAAVNKYGIGAFVTSTPPNKVPSDQVPSLPRHVKVFSGSDYVLNVQFSSSLKSGGQPISHYTVQYDTAETFNSGVNGAPLGSVLVPSNDIAFVPEVQLLSVVVQDGFHPSGTFVLSFLGQSTGELDFNISASSMEVALEKLSTVNDVSVNRELFCSPELGRSNCGKDRGYVWMVTFNDVIENGMQNEEYLSSYDSNMNDRFTVSGKYLTACPIGSPGLSDCVKNGSAVAFIESYQEIQEICLCNTVTRISIFGNSATLNSQQGVASEVESVIESISGTGSVTVTKVADLSSGSCGCLSTVTAYQHQVTFNTFRGDVPSIMLDHGTVSEVRKGISQFVDGVSDYSTFIDDNALNGTDVYIRVSAGNVIGASYYSYPSEYPVKTYKGVLSRPENVYTTVYSKTSLKVVWDKPETVTSALTYYTVEYDTSPAFISWCSDSICSSDSSYPIGYVEASNFFNTTPSWNQYEHVIQDLVAGQKYYVRVSACYNVTLDVVCSPYSFYGYPSSPIGAIPGEVPSAVGLANIKYLNSSTVRVDIEHPVVESLGSNGFPILGYMVNVSVPVQETIQVSFNDKTGKFIDEVKFTYGSSSSRCVSFSASTEELSVVIDEIEGIETVSISQGSYNTSQHSRSFLVSFDASLIDDSVSWQACTPGANYSDSVIIETVVTGENKFVPDVSCIKILSHYNETLSGYFGIRYGHVGGVASGKIVYNSAYSAPVTADVIEGERVAVLSADSSHILAIGVTIRIGDQEHVVQSITPDGLQVSFYPPATHSSVALNVYVSETLLGVATATTTTTTQFAVQADLTMELVAGDNIYISRYDVADDLDSSSYVEVDGVWTTVITISSSTITVSSVTLTGTSNIRLYSQQSLVVPHDASAQDLEYVIEEFAQVGDVSVNRYGINTFTWCVTFNSNVGTLSSSHIGVYESASVGLTVSGLTAPKVDLNGDYVSTSYFNGRRLWEKLGSPFYLAHDMSSGWTIYNRRTDQSVHTCTSSVNFAYPPISCGIAYNSVQILDASGGPDAVTISVEQNGVSPSLDNVVKSIFVKEYTTEVQSVTVTSIDGLLFGGFNLNFNASETAVYFRADESAKDFETKLESISTVGDVSVSREIVTKYGAFIGYTWSVTFNSLTTHGDIPLLVGDYASPAGLALHNNGNGASLKFVIEEVRKGVALKPIVDISDLVVGEQYTFQVSAVSAFGEGVSSATTQNDGTGAMPFSLTFMSEPKTPSIVTINPLSSSSLEVQFDKNDSADMYDIERLVVEYTTNTTQPFATSESITFRLYNSIGNDSHGYWTIGFQDSVTTWLPWGATADEVARAIEEFALTENVKVSRSQLSDLYGYAYSILMSDALGPLAIGNVTVDVSRLTAESQNFEFLFDIIDASNNFGYEPTDYGVHYLYNSCNSLLVSDKSEHQVLTIKTDGSSPDTPGAGSFRLKFRDEYTDCLEYDITTTELKSTLSKLRAVNDVFVEEHKRNTGVSTPAYRDLHIFFDAIGPELQWPYLSIPPEDNGIGYPSSLYATACTDKSLATTDVSVMTINDNVACLNGTPEIQTIVIEALENLGGYFRLYYLGTSSDFISVSATAAEVESIVNSFPDLSGVSVSRYIHNDLPFSGFAWVVTFPVSHGNVEALVIDDKYITGDVVSCGVYPLLNITILGDDDDSELFVHGHFQVVIGEDISVPLSYKATDATTLNALHNMSVVDKAAMLGYRDLDTLSGSTNQFDGYVDGLNVPTNNITIAMNVSTIISVGDTVSIPTHNYVSYIESITYMDGSSIISLNNGSLQSSSHEVTVHVGTVHSSKVAVPGKVSLSALGIVVSGAGSRNITVVSTVTDGEFDTTLTDVAIDGVLYSIYNILNCTADDMPLFCFNLLDAFTGANDSLVFNEEVMIYTTENWVSNNWISSTISSGSTVWIGDKAIVLNSVHDTYVVCDGIYLRQEYLGATAFVSGNGYERAIVIKSMTSDIRTSRVLLESDIRGTDLRVITHRSDGVSADKFVIGSLSEVQTVTFRSKSLEASNWCKNNDTAFQLMLGSDIVGNLSFESGPEMWEAALEQMAYVDKVSVTRNGDGTSPFWSYGYVYTITFWGSYGLQGVPQLTSNMINVTDNCVGVEVYHDTIRNAEYLGGSSSRHIALKEGQDYSIRVRSVNSQGISESSNIVEAWTESVGGLPSRAQSFVLGNYFTSSSLSVQYLPPQNDGGLPITGYLLEYEILPSNASTGVFDPLSESYKKLNVEVVPEIQQLTSTYSNGDDIKTRGGTFSLTFGGRTTAQLDFDISAYNLELAINGIVGTEQVAVAPVVVSRHAWIRGYKWLVTFQGVQGNVGLLQVDYSMLLGDNPVMVAEELVVGTGDIVPGYFTNEVQTVRVNSFSPVNGTFRLSMGGYETVDISFDETASGFKQILEGIPTIYTVNVARERFSTSQRLYAWTVTFKHMGKLNRHQGPGAGNIPLFEVTDNSLVPSVATVDVFQAVVGTHPLQLQLDGLDKNSLYGVRLTPYNRRGYSIESAFATAVTVDQPEPPQSIDVTVNSATSLAVQWTQSPSVSSLSGVDKYVVQYYDPVAIPEVQIITTSATAYVTEIQRVTIDADKNNLGGYFRLEYDGEITPNILWNANALGENSVGQALSRLPTVGSVDVSRAKSNRIVSGIKVNGVAGQSRVTVVEGSISSLSVSDVLRFSGSDIEYIIDSFGTSGSYDTIVFSELIDYSFSNSYVYKWSYGYTWDVTFTSLIGDVKRIVPYKSDNWVGTNALVKVDTIRDGSNPLSGFFRVDFMGSVTIPIQYDASASLVKKALEQLDTIGEVSVTRYTNGYGYDWEVTFISEIGDVEVMIVNDQGLSGANAKCVVSTLTDGESSTSSHVQVAANITSVILSDLTMGQKYAVRVSAFNENGYSYPVQFSSVIAPKQAPSAPFNVSMYALSKDKLKVVWYESLNNGGASIEYYVVQWALNDKFSEFLETKVYVSSSDSKLYCYNINLAGPNADMRQYARVYASNGFYMSVASYPAINGIVGHTSAPGAPPSVYATSISSTGILVTWEPPTVSDCWFCGDGGLPISHYIIEWDYASDFSSAAKATVHDTESLIYLIGGHNSLTGKASDVLISGYSYYIRVTPFNSKGAGHSAFVDGPVTTADRAPDAPNNVTVSIISSSSLDVSWKIPQFDGGATLEKYRVEYTTNYTFSEYEYQDFNIEHEVQSIVAEQDVTMEVQAIRLTVAVGNEKQVLRSTIEGVDEIQTVTLTCDDVLPEVQRVVTTAPDVDEIQTIEFTGTDVDEVQIITTITDDVPEVQVIDVSSPRVNEVQLFGVIVTSIDTDISGCSVGASCDGVEVDITGTFDPQFDPNLCGTIADNSDSNWCLTAMIDDDVSGYSCSDTTCITPMLNLSASPSYVQSELCGIQGSGSTGTQFLTDKNGNCVTVTRSAELLVKDSANGVYAIWYNVTFDGDYVRGDVPQLAIKHSTIAWSGSNPGTAVFTDSHGYLDIGDVSDAGNFAYELVQGNQPDGTFKLTYTCEAESVSLSSVDVTEKGVKITLPIEYELYQYIRLGTTYHRIVANISMFEAEIYPAYVSSQLITSSSTITITDAEYGVFYSDPTNDYGVSENCYNAREYTTSIISTVDTKVDLRVKLRALSDVISQATGSIEVERTYYAASESRVGYIWTVTFHRQNGNVPTMQCDESSLSSTNSGPDGGVSCNVTTYQEGSMINGMFGLAMQYPHVYVGGSEWVNSSVIPWNIYNVQLADILSADEAFGAVTVERNAYFDISQNRWTGGYKWTITFTERNGDLPDLQLINDLYSTADTAVSLTVSSYIDGNQVSGTYGFSFTDQIGTNYSCSATFIPVASSMTGEAISAVEFQSYLSLFLKDDAMVNVTRSDSPNDIMGYTYSVKFIGQVVGGDVMSLKPITNLLTHTAVASTTKKVGEICIDSTKCTVGKYVIFNDVIVSESTQGAQNYHSTCIRCISRCCRKCFEFSCINHSIKGFSLERRTNAHS